jgi:hypothetical protein
VGLWSFAGGCRCGVVCVWVGGGGGKFAGWRQEEVFMLLWRPTDYLDRLLPTFRFASPASRCNAASETCDKQGVGEDEVLDTSKRVIVLAVRACMQTIRSVLANNQRPFKHLFAASKHVHKAKQASQSRMPSHRSSPHIIPQSQLAAHSSATTTNLEETLLHPILALRVRTRKQPILINRLVLDLLGLARSLRLLSWRLALAIAITVDSLSSGSTLLPRRSLGSLDFRRAAGVAGLGGDFLLDLGPGVGRRDGIGHASESGEFLVIGLWRGLVMSLLRLRVCVCICWAIAYFRLLAEAQPGQSHELALAVGEGVLRVDDGSHAGGR